MLAVAVARYLPTVVDGLTFDEAGDTGNVFVASIPSTPDAAVMVMPSGGLPQMSKAPTDRPTVQILTRGPRNDPRPGLATAWAIYSQLTCLDGVTLDEGGPDEVQVIGCTAMQSAPSPLGMDENQRHEWSQNFAFRTRSLTVHRN